MKGDLTHLLPGKVYRSADPRWGIQVRIRSYTPGGSRAVIQDVLTGRYRWILVRYLHPNPLTSKGKPWRTGYVLEEE